MADNTQKFDLDTLDASLVEEIIEINGEANAMEGPAPVDDGVHRVKLLPLESSEVEVKETNPKKGGTPTPYIGFRFSGSVIDEGGPNNNKRIFGRVNTLVFDGKSEMAQYIKVAKGGGPDAVAYVSTLNNYVKLAQAFKEVLASEPIIKVKTRWVAARKEEDGSYKTVLSGQKKFPQRADGKGYQSTIFDQKSQAEINAQVEIVDIFPDK